MSVRYRPPETRSVLLPFQPRVHEVFESVSRKASVKYREPDCCAIELMLSVVQVSK